MPNRVQWSPGYNMGHETLDREHQNILAQCNVLADCISDAAQESDQTFQQTFNTLMAQAAEHFATEEALLTQSGYPMLEEHQNEHDEFDYLANEIITTENFEKIELQRFLSLWWVGHIVGSGKKYRAYLELMAQCSPSQITPALPTKTATTPGSAAG
jgi:hemerythrin-like metal-binding protein